MSGKGFIYSTKCFSIQKCSKIISVRGSIRFRPRWEGLYYSALPYQLFQSWIENGRSNIVYIFGGTTQLKPLIRSGQRLWVGVYLDHHVHVFEKAILLRRNKHYFEMYQNRNQNRWMYQNRKIPKYRFSLQLYTKMHGFKYEFSKFFWGEAYRIPSPDPLPAQSQASPSILGRFASLVRAAPSIHPSNMFNNPSTNRGVY